VYPASVSAVLSMIIVLFSVSMTTYLLSSSSLSPISSFTSFSIASALGAFCSVFFSYTCCGLTGEHDVSVLGAHIYELELLHLCFYVCAFVFCVIKHSGPPSHSSHSSCSFL